MADELDTFVTALVGKLGEIVGIEVAPEDVVEAPNNLPMVTAYFVRGRPSNPVAGTWIHRVHADIHTARSAMPHDYKYLRPFILKGIAKLNANVKMDSSCEHCTIENYLIVRFPETSTVGVRFVLEVKMQHSGIGVSA
jgi:hypothetical protein